MYDLTAMGARIRQLRNQKGLTQDSFAKELGISAQAVSKWETGAGCPDIAMLPLIAGILECSIDALFSDVAMEPTDTQAPAAKPTTNNLSIVHTYKGVNCESDMKPISIENCIVRFPNGGWADLAVYTVNKGNGSGTILLSGTPEVIPALSAEMETDLLDQELDALSDEIDRQMQMHDDAVRMHDERLKEQEAAFAEAEARFNEAEKQFDEKVEKRFAEAEKRFAEKEKTMEDGSYHFDRERYRAMHGLENAQIHLQAEANQLKRNAAHLGDDIIKEVEQTLESTGGDFTNLGALISEKVNRIVSRSLSLAGISSRRQNTNAVASSQVWQGVDIRSLYLRISGSADVTVECGTPGQWRVEAQGSTEFLEHLSCTEDGNTLKIETMPYQQKNLGLFSPSNSIVIYTGFTDGEELDAELRGSGDMDCQVNFEVSRIGTYGSGDVELKDAGYLNVTASGSGDVTLVRGRNAYVSSSGSCDVEIAALEGVSEFKTSGSGDVSIGSAIGSLTFRSSGSGDLDLNIAELETLTVYTSGAGDVDVGSGTVGNLDLTLRGAGDFDGSGLTVDDLTAVLSGASEATIGRVNGRVSQRVGPAANLTIG